MKWYNKVLHFIKETIRSTAEREAARREYEKRAVMKSTHLQQAILSVLISCKHIDHIDSVRGWIDYMLQQDILTPQMHDGLDKAVELKATEFQTERKPLKQLPHLLEREERIAQLLNKPHLKVVKVHKIL